jgi:translation initiation factor IF-2
MGGDTIFCEVSAKQKLNIEELLELILLQADVLELQADPDRPARAWSSKPGSIVARSVATVLIQEGTLKEGDAFVSKPSTAGLEPWQ